MKLEPDFWRGAFAEEGGVAHVGPKYPSQNFTVTSGMKVQDAILSGPCSAA